MSQLALNTDEIFAVACQSSEPEDMSISVGDSLFRIQRAHGRVRVEGRSGLNSCVLQSGTGSNPAAYLLLDRPAYCLVHAREAA